MPTEHNSNVESISPGRARFQDVLTLTVCDRSPPDDQEDEEAGEGV